MQSLVLNFHEIDKSFIPIVGWKWANLWELIKAGFQVPEWFCITVEAFKLFVSQNNKYEKLVEKLEWVNFNELKKISRISESIRNHILSLELPEILVTEILEALKNIWSRKSFAVRSSATCEDLPEASFAWQQETFLNIKWEDEILIKVKECFASLFTDRAVSYRLKNDFSNKTVFLCVVVQEMIFSEVSWIMFTADPITWNRNIVSINSSFGLWESIVWGHVIPDLYTVIGSKILKKDISQKRVQMTTEKEWWIIQTDIKPNRQSNQSLSDKQILELANLWKKIEKHYKKEQDIEWCFKNGNFFIVQTRPITSLYPLPEIVTKGLHFYLSIGHVQMMTEAIRPLWFSVFTTISRFVEDYFKMDWPLLNDAGSHLYIDLIHLLKYKVFRNNMVFILSNVDESSSKILKEFMRTRRFKYFKSRRISIKRQIVIAKFLYSELKILFKGNLDNIYDELDHNIYSKLWVIKNEIQEAESIWKISKIKSIITNLPLAVLETNILKYMPLAIWTYKTLWYYSKKWLWDTNEIDAIWKAPEWNVTTEMWLVIWDIADIVNKNEALKEYLETCDNVDFWKNVEKNRWWKEFSELFLQFLKKYWMRSTWEIDITNTRWKENPMQVVSLILNSAHNTEIGQTRNDFLLSKQEWIEASKRFVDRVKKTRFGFLKAFFIKRLIYVYRSTIWVREHPKFFLINVIGIFRDTILEEAKILIKNKVIEEVEDLYYFSLEEIQEIIEKNTIDKDLLEKRKFIYKRDSRNKPPRVFTWEWEILLTKPNTNIPSWFITWTGASSWIIEGRARVILKLEDAELENGDILVTSYTDPAWTTLFWIVTGVVTEVWGLLTHGAVVAREYWIPAVVWVDNATRIIKDWMKIRVNWNDWTVEIL